ncbi:MAG TPA: hypothetical protein VJM12_03725 [Pyrinomonadaceae bacterium]|nr:hypothetical protein [Pyrinomonadaceae bacterium]
MFSVLSWIVCVSPANAHQDSSPLLTRTGTRTETRRLGYGGSVTIIGAPQGSITIEGWARNEVAITASIELKAATEEDLNRLATVNGFILDDDLNHVRVLTTGTHDKEFMRRAAKNFPKKLLGLPWKIDYRIRVPAVTDLEINAGRGPINLKDVEGAIRLSATESETSLTLAGGTVSVTVASGKVGLRIPVRSWRGGGADVRVASGDLSVEIPPGFNGDIDAEILHVGKIENAFSELQSRERPGVTERLIKGRAGAGGAFFKFTVANGTITIKKAIGQQ